MQSLWPLVIAVALFLLCVLLWLGYTKGARITGFGPHVVKQIETFEYPGDDEESGKPEKRSITTETQSARTLWEWLTILTISAVIAGAALWFTTRQVHQQQEVQVRQANDARELQVRQANDARELQVRQANDEALQAYLDKIGTLLLDKNRPLRQSHEGEAVADLARARTLTLLDMLSPDRKPRVLEFLFEVDLIQTDSPDQKKPIISLKFADLHEVVLAKRHLLKGADLEHAVLYDANLRGATLSSANLRKADLVKAKLTKAVLTKADLTDADLDKAELSKAVLTEADLTEATLKGAKGISCQQMKQTKSLEDAIMPGGQNYEDWLKDKGCSQD
jgi:uncharacterized protein YjbI with pentapeptide repeats